MVTVHGNWTEWSQWSSCSKTCGYSVKHRKRHCGNPSPKFGGQTCVGRALDSQYCKGNPKCNCEYSTNRTLNSNHSNFLGQVRSECLMCTFRTSCCSTRLSWAQIPALLVPLSGTGRKKGGRE